MRRLLTQIGLAALPLIGCGFDTTSTNPQNPATGGTGSTTTGTGGAPTTTGRVPATNGGTSAAGQPAGTAGTAVTPQGGKSSQAGTSGSGGVSNGGSGMAGGGAAAGGARASNGGSAGAGGTTPADPHFKLAWRDDFDTFDDTRWTKQTNTFDENLARFSAANVEVAGGLLKLHVTKVQNGDKAYSAAEVATKDLFTYGRFVGHIKFCVGSGMVSSLFTYKDNDVATSWQEIDIEDLGNLPKSVQYNLISGNLANRVYQPHVVTFQYAPPADFHDYTIEWAPDGVTFFVDGAQTWHDAQAKLKDPARLHMNAWPTNNAFTTFAGTFDASAVPCEADYDWVEAYTYAP